MCGFIACFLLLYSCRQELDLTRENQQKREEAFFKTDLKKLNSIQKQVLSYLETKNKENHFVSSLKDQSGLPVWETTKFLKDLSSTKEVNINGKTATLSNGNLLYSVPLVEDGFITSVLYSEIKEGEVVNIREITNEDLWHIIHDDKYEKSFREFILLNCLSYDKELFGNNLFGNLPTGLLGLTEKSNHRIRMANTNTSENSKILLNFNCVMYYANCQGCTGSCDGCGGYGGTICILTRNCTATWTDDGTLPTTGSTDTPGTGGGSTTSTPTQQAPKDPCSLGIQGKAFYRLKPNCDVMGGGIDEDLNPPQTNCETIKEANEEQKVKDAIADLKTKTTGKQEFAYEIERKYNNTTLSYDFTTIPRIGTEFGTMVATGGYVKGQAHNHPSTGMSIPSIGDIIWLKLCKENIAPTSANAYNIVICYDPANPSDTNSAIVYSITIDDYSTLETKINELWDRADLQGFTDAQKYDILNGEMSKAFKDVQNNSEGMEKRFIETYSSFGISLNKQDKVTNNWDKLSVNNNVVTKIPCQ